MERVRKRKSEGALLLTGSPFKRKVLEQAQKKESGKKKQNEPQKQQKKQQKKEKKKKKVTCRADKRRRPKTAKISQKLPKLVNWIRLQTRQQMHRGGKLGLLQVRQSKLQSAKQKSTRVIPAKMRSGLVSFAENPSLTVSRGKSGSNARIVINGRMKHALKAHVIFFVLTVTLSMIRLSLYIHLCLDTLQVGKLKL